MWKVPQNPDQLLLTKFGKNAKIAGVVFMIIGAIGAIYPVFMSLATVAFVAWLMLFGGIIGGYFTYATDPKDIGGWMKSFILVIIALYILFKPMAGIATVGLLFSIYFFMDSFGNFSLATSNYPRKGWWLWLLNAVMSLIIAVIFVWQWPFSSLYLIGLLVGFSLFFDGLVLFLGGKTLKDMAENGSSEQ